MVHNGELEDGRFKIKESRRSTPNHRRISQSCIFHYNTAVLLRGYAQDVVKYKGGIPNMIEAEVGIDNFLDLREYNEVNVPIVESIGIDRSQFQYQDTKNLWEISENEDMVNQLKEKGYHGILINEDVALEIFDIQDPAYSIGVFDPDSINIINESGSKK